MSRCVISGPPGPRPSCRRLALYAQRVGSHERQAGGDCCIMIDLTLKPATFLIGYYVDPRTWFEPQEQHELVSGRTEPG